MTEKKVFGSVFKEASKNLTFIFPYRQPKV